MNTKNQLNFTSTNLQDPLSGASFREPLLEGTETEASKLSIGVYGSTRNRHAQLINNTHSTVELSE